MGRTDAKVSANETFVELFIDDEPLEMELFFEDFNNNLPQDIRALSIEETDANFNIIQHPKLKEYIYLFTFGDRMHPFCAPFMVCFREMLDISIMKKAALLFEGTHDFKNYTYKPTVNTETVGTIKKCELLRNTLYSASFFPKETYILRVIGEGFKRHQIRLMMGALFDLGSGKMTFEEFKHTLDPSVSIHLSHIAPPSGLLLQSVKLLS